MTPILLGLACGNISKHLKAKIQESPAERSGVPLPVLPTRFRMHHPSSLDFSIHECEAGSARSLATGAKVHRCRSMLPDVLDAHAFCSKRVLICDAYDRDFYYQFFKPVMRAYRHA